MGRLSHVLASQMLLQSLIPKVRHPWCPTPQPVFHVKHMIVEIAKPHVGVDRAAKVVGMISKQPTRQASSRIGGQSRQRVDRHAMVNVDAMRSAKQSIKMIHLRRQPAYGIPL